MKVRVSASRARASAATPSSGASVSASSGASPVARPAPDADLSSLRRDLSQSAMLFAFSLTSTVGVAVLFSLVAALAGRS